MVLESTVICFDNSDYQRNGDYIPSRLSVQKEGTNLVCMSKLRGNPENNVSLITFANTIDVLCTLTNDSGRLYTKMQTIQPKGNAVNLITGIRVAHLLLKHRHSKNHKMRIVVFVGSPVQEVNDDMQKLAKRLKKEKVNVDVISFGNHDTNDTILIDFIQTLNGRDGNGSHLLSVPRGSDFANALLSSPIIQGDDGTGGAGLTSEAIELGFDPNEDPELALALRLSMEEQRMRERGATPSSLPQEQAPTPPLPADGNAVEAEPSIADLNIPIVSSSASNISSTQIIGPLPLHMTPDFTNMTEEEQIAFAIEMSMQDPIEIETENLAPANDVDYESVESVIRSLPGVDPQSENVQETMNSNTEDPPIDSKNKKK